MPSEQTTSKIYIDYYTFHYTENMNEEKDVIEKGILISRRRVIELGGSKAVTLPSRWLDIQKWLGREFDELVSVADNLIVLAPPEERERAIELLKKAERSKK